MQTNRTLSPFIIIAAILLAVTIVPLATASDKEYSSTPGIGFSQAGDSPSPIAATSDNIVGNSDNSNAGGNSDNSNAGGNSDNSNAGGNSDNSNAGGNSDNSNAGGNSDNSNAGGNAGGATASPDTNVDQVTGNSLGISGSQITT